MGNVETKVVMLKHNFITLFGIRALKQGSPPRVEMQEMCLKPCQFPALWKGF